MSSDLHNIQVILSQIPRIQKLSEHSAHLIPNGNQIITLEQEKAQEKKMHQVQEFEEIYKTKAEDSERNHIRDREHRQRKRGQKKKGEKEPLIDIYG